MANKHCGIFARIGQQTKQVKRLGHSGIVPVEAATYWLRWRDGGKQMYRNVGEDPEAALAERKRQERLLAGFADPPPLPAGLRES